MLQFVKQTNCNCALLVERGHPARLFSCARSLILIVGILLSRAAYSNPSDNWLDVVHWIISDAERQAYLTLKTEPDRTRFIETFWVNRDPTPGTAQNEFREEHLRRYEYANQQFGRESSLAGWKTDRGRVYILLGKPRFITRNPAPFEMQPVELWQYSGNMDYGLPASLYLMFFQEKGVGPYKLYSPLNDGIHSLFKAQPGLFLKTEEELFSYLSRINLQMAHASLSYLPSEGGIMDKSGISRGSVATEVILGKLENARNYDPTRRKYIDDFFRDRPTVKVYYSLNSDLIRHGFFWFQAPTGNFYLDYAVEYLPEQLDMGQYEDQYYTAFLLDGQITNSDGVLVDTIHGAHEVKLSRDQFTKIANLPFQLEGRKPIVPGTYNITLVVTNQVTGQSSTFAEKVEIPEPSAKKLPSLTPILPIRSVEMAAADGKLRPFQYGDKLLLPNLAATCTRSVQVYNQIIFPSDFQNGKDLTLHYVVSNGDKVEMEKIEELHYSTNELAGSAVDVRKEIVCDQAQSGARKLMVELRQAGTTISQSGPLMFSCNVPSPAGMWKYAIAIPQFDSGYHVYVLSQQLVRQKKTTEAIRMLETALAADPDALELRIGLMRAALKAKQYRQVLQTGAPAETRNPNHSEILWLMGWASYGLNDFADTVRFFERLRMIDPKRVEVLNVLADAYYRTDQRAKSLERVEQSLALKPDQKDLLELRSKLQ